MTTLRKIADELARSPAASMSKREQVIEAALAANRAASSSLASIQPPGLKILLAEYDRPIQAAASLFTKWDARQIDQQYNVNRMIEILEGRQAPTVRWQPEPEPPKPIAPADWRRLIDEALSIATPKEVAGYARQRDTRRSRSPSIEELKKVYDTYNDLKPTKTANEIAMRLHMSTAKLYRWLDDYEERTANNENS